jgi:hypothetical protein
MDEQAGGVVMISKAPDDPAEKAEWARAMTRIQVAMWVDGAFGCSQCKRPFASVDDFLAREPRYAGPMPEGDTSAPFVAVDDACWPEWERAAGIGR